MFGLWDETTPGCAGICHGLALWGAAEVMALLAMIFTVAGLIYAGRSLRASVRSAAETAESARKLLVHEQSAVLQIPYRPSGHYELEIPNGGYLWITDPAGSEEAVVSGRMHNVGRYDAREVKLTIVRHNGERPALLEVPPPYLESGGYVHHFSFQMPIAVEDAELRAGKRSERSVILIQAEYSDANDREPSDAKTRIWRSSFPNVPLTRGTRAKLIDRMDISAVLRSE